MSVYLNDYCEMNEILLIYSGNYDKNTAFFPFVPDIYYIYITNHLLNNSYFAYFPKTKQKILYYLPIDTKWSENYSRILSKNSDIKQKPIHELFRDIYSNQPKKIIGNSILSNTNVYNKLSNLYIIELLTLESSINKNRGIKFRKEIENIKKSCGITSIVFKQILSKARKYRNEKEIINDIECNLKSRKKTFNYLSFFSNSL